MTERFVNFLFLSARFWGAVATMGPSLTSSATAWASRGGKEVLFSFFFRHGGQ